MQRPTYAAILLAAILCAAPAFAGSSVSIRLVQADNSGSGVGGGLDDVSELLKSNLPFNSFKLVSSGSVQLPAGGSAGLGQGFAAQCKGSQDSMQITVTRGGKKVLDTKVGLQDDVPLILGGFPAGSGKLMLVLLAQ